MTALLAVKGGDPGFHGSGIGGSGGSWLARLRHVIFYHRTGGGETEEEEEEMVRSRRKREKLEKKKRKEKRSFGARVTSERPSLLGGSEKERERAAGRGLLFRLLESRLVSEAGGPIGGVLPWTPRSVADQSCSIVARTCYIACRRAPPPGIARRPRVFPFVETFYATFPTTPLSLSPSLSLSLLVFPFTELLWLLWSEKLGQPHTCSHLSADTGEGHGPAGSNEHAPSSSPDPIIGSF